MKSWREKKIDIYLSAVIIPSIILSILAIWALHRQYNLINYLLKNIPAGSLPEAGWLSFLSKIGIFSFSMIVFSLILILIIASLLSSKNIQRELELTKLKNEFVSVVSHELKTPLTSIRLLAERLTRLSPEELDKQKEYLNIILTQSYRLSHLIENILDFSRLQEGKEKYNFEKVDLISVIKEAIDNYPIKVLRPDCVLEINISLAVALKLYLDKEAICRAFLNLLDNALKFSPKEGRVTINLYGDEKEVFIEVRDEGPGIKEEEKKRIFEPFYHKGKGTGLGLALSQQIVRAHNGRIEFESQKDKGTIFKIILPIQHKIIDV
ncbi:MAG: HAMP domain-containing histidine kinase [Candidatus Omnitrophica bacterium]|nr:HAMP domain-containing histidine kinase [Candidatus Omnitrophota bacterium]